jgi:hypothetical protein
MFSKEIPQARLDQWIEFDKKLRIETEAFRAEARKVTAEARSRYNAAMAAADRKLLANGNGWENPTLKAQYLEEIEAARSQYKLDLAPIAELRSKFWSAMGGTGSTTDDDRFWLDVAALKRRAVADAPVFYGDYLRKARKTLGLNADQFAKLAEFSPRTVKLWEWARRPINNWATFCIYAYWAGYRPDNWPEPKKRRARSN